MHRHRSRVAHRFTLEVLSASPQRVWMVLSRLYREMTLFRVRRGRAASA